MKLATLHLAVVLASVAACASPPAMSPSRGAPTVSPGPVIVPPEAPPPSVAPSPAPETPEARAARLHRAAIIVDGHDDIPSVLYGSGVDLEGPKTGRRATMHTDLARMKRGGITGSFFSIYVEGDLATKPTVLGGGALRRALDLVDVTYRAVERHPADLLLATSATDIRRAKAEGKIAVLMGVEGGHAIENSLGALRTLHRLGCRYMTLTHTNTNAWADSAGFSGPPPVRHHGLTPFGEEVVREMQRIGMLVDVAHVSDETFWAVMRIAAAPVIASHSSARAIAGHRRNLDDGMLRAMAKNGGVVMINFWSLFLSDAYGSAVTPWMAKNKKAIDELRKAANGNPLVGREGLQRMTADAGFPRVPLTVLVDHVDHVVKIAGIDHVGLGSDFDGVDALPDGLTGIDDLPKITEELVRRGYRDDEVLKILGGNFLRAFEAAEAYARGTKTTLSGDGSTKKIDR